MDISDNMPERAKRNKIYAFFWRLSYNPYFFLVSLMLIAFNTLVLALDSYPIDKDKSKFINLVNDILNFIFLAEITIKMIGLGI